MPYDFTVRGRSALQPPGADARVDQRTVEDGAVGRRSDRLSVELQLLLGVSELKGTRALVRRRLFSV